MSAIEAQNFVFSDTFTINCKSSDSVHSTYVSCQSTYAFVI
jgi:hypothetical protein